MIKRMVGWLASLAGLLALAGSLCLWFALSQWLPTKGKALLIDELERRWPIEVSIGTLRYYPLRGVLIDDVLITERATSLPWFQTERLVATIGWLPLIFYREVVFRAHAPIVVPCQTDLELSGHYHLGSKSLTLDGQTGAIALETLTAALTPYVPKPLTAGRVHLRARLEHRPGSTPAMTGHVVGTDLVWTSQPVHISGNLAMDASAAPPPVGKGPWSIRAVIHLREGAAEGVPVVGTIDRLRGTARLSNNQLEIEELIGTMMGSEWRMEGTVASLAHPSLEALLTSQATLQPLLDLLPHLKEAWQPNGRLDIRASCRVAFQSRVTPDCLARASFRDVTLNGILLSDPLTQMAGQVEYDLLSRRLLIQRLEARILNESLRASGEIAFQRRPQLALALNGTLPLETLRGWLSDGQPVSEPRGRALLDLQIRGRPGALRYLGTMELQRAHLRLAALPNALEEMSGRVALGEGLVSIPHLSLKYDGQPGAV